MHHIFVLILCQLAVFYFLPNQASAANRFDPALVDGDARPQDFTFLPPRRFGSWCSDSKERFEINSIDCYNKGSPLKSCTWAARTDTFWGCSINKVLSNYPVTCDFCECSNNPGRFETPILPMEHVHAIGRRGRKLNSVARILK